MWGSAWGTNATGTHPCRVSFFYLHFKQLVLHACTHSVWRSVVGDVVFSLEEGKEQSSVCLHMAGLVAD